MTKLLAVEKLFELELSSLRKKEIQHKLSKEQREGAHLDPKLLRFRYTREDSQSAIGCRRDNERIARFCDRSCTVSEPPMKGERRGI